MPDLGAAFMAYMTLAAEHISDENWDADFEEFYNLLTKDDAVMATNTVTVTMVKGENGLAISVYASELGAEYSEEEVRLVRVKFISEMAN